MSIFSSQLHPSQVNSVPLMSSSVLSSLLLSSPDFSTPLNSASLQSAQLSSLLRYSQVLPTPLKSSPFLSSQLHPTPPQSVALLSSQQLVGEERSGVVSTGLKTSTHISRHRSSQVFCTPLKSVPLLSSLLRSRTSSMASMLTGLKTKRALVGSPESPVSVMVTILPCSPTIDLHVLGLFPITGEWDGGQSLLTAVQMAIEDINSRDDILPGYNLNLTWSNSNCSAGRGIRAMTDNLYNGPTRIVIVGGACSTVSQATSQASYLWNLVQVSYGSSSPALSNKARFPKFMRLASADTAVTSMRIRMFKQLGWSRVATIYQNYELFTLVNDNLLEEFSKENLTVVTSEVFKNSPVTQVQRLKDKDARIIVGGFYPEKGRHVLCESYKIGLIYPRVIWILIGWLNVKWYMEKDVTIDCTPDQMARALEGAIYTGFLYLDPFDTPTISGLTPSEFTLHHWMRNNNKTLPGDILASQGYDVTWTIALGLNATMTTLRETGSNKTLEDFTYTDKALGDLIHSHMLNVSFQALKGPVSFDKNGDLIGYVTVEQIQDGERRMICVVREDQEGTLDLTLARWEGGVPPKDGVLTYTLTLTLSPVLYGFMCTLAALGLLASIAFLFFNIYNRKVK
ncbi:gamma-aminobutyric acid type B receptor subunit 1-like [Haliotis asinina]|uniref:gamma-aminobutyric acid type B receptor subunit 1-like n=1 Tax=Haliotis asinina TaxID=109174 RepID=UPI003531E4A6